MKKVLLLFLLFFLSATTYAQRKSVLSVLMKDGTSVCFYLSELPVVTFVDDDVKIVSSTEEAQVKRTLVDHFEFLDEMPTDVDELEGTSETFELTANTIYVGGLDEACKVQVFSLNGRVVLSGVAGNDGSVKLSLASLSSGVYLVNYNETTIKFIKR